MNLFWTAVMLDISDNFPQERHKSEDSPGTSKSRAALLLQRYCKSFEEVFYPYASGADFLIRRLTCAFGMADLKSAPLRPVLQLFQQNQLVAAQRGWNEHEPILDSSDAGHFR